MSFEFEGGQKKQAPKNGRGGGKYGKPGRGVESCLWSELSFSVQGTSALDCVSSEASSKGTW